jgi:EF-P beta-lysylation protein EpmB
MNAAPGALRLRATPGWQEQLRDAIRTPQALAEALEIPAGALPFDEAAAQDFPLLVPRAFARRMRRGDPDDPLLRQVLAIPDERQHVPGFTEDPVGELHIGTRTEGVLRKYAGRALLLATGHCAVNCRYCFRRHFPYGEGAVGQRERLARVAQIAADPGITELILSGGDPLLLGDAQLAALTGVAAESPTLRTLRVHTRLPVVIPDRVTDGLLQALRREALRTVVVLHANHGREVDAALTAAIRRMVDAGITVLNQSVLLAGVNDSAETLAELSDALFDAGALPYYLHLLDPVAGAGHFAVAEPRARRIVGELAAMRPGYLVPRLAQEIAGAASKRELAPDYGR